MSVRGWPSDEGRTTMRGRLSRVSIIEGRTELRVDVVIEPSTCGWSLLTLASSRWHRTLYGARMAARQARLDYSPGGRLYAEPRKVAGGES